MPSHASRRAPRATAPALLIALVGCALTVLALLPAPAAPPARVVATAVRPLQLTGDVQREVVLGRPPAGLVAKAHRRPAPRPAAKRVSRQRPPAPPPVGRYTCPVAARVSFTDTWGDPRPGGRDHQGTDILAAYGAPVVAVTSGIVKTNYSTYGGISLYIEGDDGVEYFYAHNSRNVVRTGQRVRTGQLVGYVGTTGDARGGPPHVHFERHPGGSAVNPYPFVRRICG